METARLLQLARRPLCLWLSNYGTIGDCRLRGVPVSFTVFDGGADAGRSGSSIPNGLGRASTSVIAGQTIGTLAVEARAGELGGSLQPHRGGKHPLCQLCRLRQRGQLRRGLGSRQPGVDLRDWSYRGAGGYSASEQFSTSQRARRCERHGQWYPGALFFLSPTSAAKSRSTFRFPWMFPRPRMTLQSRLRTTAPLLRSRVSRTHLVQPGIFQITLPEGLFAAALHSDFSPVTPDNPARPSEVILLFLTGLGSTEPPIGTNVPGPVPAATSVIEPTVTVDGLPAKVFGSFYAPTLVAVYQINFVVPTTAPSGKLEDCGNGWWDFQPATADSREAVSRLSSLWRIQAC